MRQIFTILKKETVGFFSGLQGYIIISIYLVFVGGMTFYLHDSLGQRHVDARPFFFWAAVALLILVPALTMRTFAEENRSGAIELLLTLPVADEIIVIGKYLSVLTLIALSLSLTVTYPLTLHFYGEIDWGAMVGGYLGLFLLGASFAAIGMAASCSSKNQMFSFLITFVLSALPFVTGYALDRIPVSALPWVQFLSFEYHFGHLARGMVDSKDLFYYVSIIALFLHLTLLQLELRRLRS